nr:MAG TPA: attachment protein [Inoviridae sp.]
MGKESQGVKMKMQEKIRLLLVVVMAVVSVESVAAIINKEDISVVSNTSGMYDWSLSRYVVYKTKDGRYFAGQDNLFCKGDCKDGGLNGIDTELFDSPQEALKKKYGSISRCDYQKLVCYQDSGHEEDKPEEQPKNPKEEPPSPTPPKTDDKACGRNVNGKWVSEPCKPNTDQPKGKIKYNDQPGEFTVTFSNEHPSNEHQGGSQKFTFKGIFPNGHGSGYTLCRDVQTNELAVKAGFKCPEGNVFFLTKVEQKKDKEDKPKDKEPPKPDKPKDDGKDTSKPKDPAKPDDGKDGPDVSELDGNKDGKDYSKVLGDISKSLENIQESLNKFGNGNGGGGGGSGNKGDPNGHKGGEDTGETDMAKYCKEHPNALSCTKLGTEEDIRRTVGSPDGSGSRIGIPKETVGLPGFNRSNDFSESGTCPAPKQFVVMGSQQEFSYQPICDGARGLRPFIISAAIFIAFVICRQAIISKT